MFSVNLNYFFSLTSLIPPTAPGLLSSAEKILKIKFKNKVQIQNETYQLGSKSRF
jgi:hypothetical protein